MTALKAGVLNEVAVTDRKGMVIQPGDNVRICPGHPHSGRIGIYKGVEHLAATNNWGCLVRFEDDVDGCYVLRAMYWEKVKS